MSSMCHFLFRKSCQKSHPLFDWFITAKEKKINHILNFDGEYESNDTNKNKYYTYFSTTYQICLPMKKQNK